ncbi:MAG: hypothetical protein L7F78_14980, partial [Syntrophales bacterium LBB04]|nr:hypothetical protein [Syntrophales bacterium LBB04]
MYHEKNYSTDDCRFCLPPLAFIRCVRGGGIQSKIKRVSKRKDDQSSHSAEMGRGLSGGPARSSPTPTFLWITDGRVEIRDAAHLWGKDTIDTEDRLQTEFGDAKVRVACIGPASERLSLISGIVNDRGRIAARSGVGAVMGSKRLKALAVRGHAKVPVANPAELSRLAKAFAKELRGLPGMAQAL